MKKSARYLQKFYFLIIFLVLLGCSYFYFRGQQSRYSGIISFDECVKAGFLVTTSYPEKCKLPGKIFINPAHEKKVIKEDSVAPLTIEESYKNLAYFIDGQKVDFHDGIGVLTSLLPKHATSTFTIIPAQILFDANNDISPDIFFLISKVDSTTKNSSLYLSAGVTLNTGYVGLNALYVASSTTLLPILIHKNGKIYIEYTDTLGTKKAKYFILQNSILKEVI